MQRASLYIRYYPAGYAVGLRENNAGCYSVQRNDEGDSLAPRRGEKICRLSTRFVTSQ